MNSLDCESFWAGGHVAWWRGLRDEIRTAAARLKSAATGDERAEARARLDELRRQEADAWLNGHRWLH